MELTQKAFNERLNILKKFLADPNEEQFDQLRCNMHEKGVECAIIMPLLEVVLDFDALEDIHYEEESKQKHGQRFDFLVKDKMLLEAKMLGANLDEHYKQLSKYIKGNENINYGLLSNGIEYQIWIQKSYMEKVTDKKLNHIQDVAKIFEMSLKEDSVDFFINVLPLFSKSKFEESFKRIACIAGYYITGGRGRTHILHEDRKINNELCLRIKDAVEVKKGVFYEDVQNGKISAGDRLKYCDDFVEIIVKVTETGTVLLKPGQANIHNVIGAVNSGWEPMLKLIAGEWQKSENEFQDPIEIIKLAQNKQRLHNQDKYKFVRVIS